MATMSQIDHLLERAVRTKQNIRFLSKPGIGKTTKIMQFIARKKQENPDFYAAVYDGGTMSPSDLIMAMPNVGNGTIDKLTDADLPNFYETPDLVGVIYFGEWQLMGLETAKGAQKIINHEDYAVGKRIPPGVICVADGQRLVDRSGAQADSRAIARRFTTYTMDMDAEYGLDVAKAHFHTKVAAFLIRNPGQLDNYEDVFEKERSANDLTLQEGKHGAWAYLGSWAKVSDVLFDGERSGAVVYPEELQACLGSGVANSFEIFCQMLDKLATMEDIIAHPDKALVPDRMDEMYALATMLALTVNVESFKPIAIYQQRYPDELQAVFFRLMNDRLTKNKTAETAIIRGTKEYKEWITAKHITKLLIGATQS